MPLLEILLSHAKNLPFWVKASIVFSGYALAFFLAICAVLVNGLLMGDALGQEAGMASFSDALIFLLVFISASLSPTGMWAFFIWLNRRP